AGAVVGGGGRARPRTASVVAPGSAGNATVGPGTMHAPAVLRAIVIACNARVPPSEITTAGQSEPLATRASTTRRWNAGTADDANVIGGSACSTIAMPHTSRWFVVRFAATNVNATLGTPPTDVS